MTVEVDLYNTLQSLVGGRVYPDVAPENTEKPYITYQQVGGESNNFLDATISSKKNGRFQINLWATSRIAAADLSRQIEDTLLTSALYAMAMGAPTATYETDTKLYGTRQFFSIWF